MPLDTWSGRNELLNEFHTAIHRRTRGRLSDLSLDVIDGALVLEARTKTYYAVQLALAAIQAFTADFPKLTPVKLSFRVNGRPLVLGIPQADRNGQAAHNDDPLGNSDSMLPDWYADQQSPSSVMSSAAAMAAT